MVEWITTDGLTEYRAAEAWMEQRVAVCDGPNGEEIAFASVGDGPVLILAAWWTSHLELDSQRKNILQCPDH